MANEDFIPLTDIDTEEFIPLTEVDMAQTGGKVEKKEDPIDVRGEGLIENVFSAPKGGYAQYGMLGQVAQSFETGAIHAARGLSFGMSERVAAFVVSQLEEGVSYDEALKLAKDYHVSLAERDPATATIAEIGGVMRSPINKIAEMSKVGTSALKEFYRVASNMIINAGEGLGYGYLTANSTDEEKEQAIFGGTFGAVTGVFSKPARIAARSLALKSIAVNEKAITKMSAFIPGGRKAMGEYLLDNALISPRGSIKSVLKKIIPLEKTIKEESENIVNLASEYGPKINMKTLYMDTVDEAIQKLAEGGTNIHKNAAKRIQNVFKGWFERPIRSLKEANQLRKNLDDALSDTYDKIKEARFKGQRGSLYDRNLVEARAMITKGLDDIIDGSLLKARDSGKISDSAYKTYKSVKTQHQFLIEAKNSAIQRIGSGADSLNVKPRDVAFAFMYPRYGTTKLAIDSVSRRAASSGASILKGLSEFTERASGAASTIPKKMMSQRDEEPIEPTFTPLTELNNEK